MPRLPEGWHEPSPLTLQRYVHGREHGLVPTWHDVLKKEIPPLPERDVASHDVRQVVGAMFAVIDEMRRAKRPIWGLAATQLGEEVPITVVPKTMQPLKFIAVINPKVIVEEGAPRLKRPFGCYSSLETFTILDVPAESRLTGYDVHGQPIDLQRSGSLSAIDDHETNGHLKGVLPPDLAIAHSSQIDHRPAEETEAYREYFSRFETDNSLRYRRYLYAQWIAATRGEFLLEPFLNR